MNGFPTHIDMERTVCVRWRQHSVSFSPGILLDSLFVGILSLSPDLGINRARWPLPIVWLADLAVVVVIFIAADFVSDRVHLLYTLSGLMGLNGAQIGLRMMSL